MHAKRLLQATHLVTRQPHIVLLAANLLLGLLAVNNALAMHHEKGESKTEQTAQLALAESFIDAFYSFNEAKLAPLMDQAEESKPRLLYYQGWAQGGNYIVLDRAACAMEDTNKVACPVTVQDDPVVALNTGFNVTDTFHLTFEGEMLVAVDTSSNDQPIYYEARKWVEANRPGVMTGPCKNRNTADATPGDCARAMTKGYQEFYETVVVPREQ